MKEERKKILSDMLSSMTECSLEYASKVIEIVSDIPLTLSKLVDKINSQQLKIEELEKQILSMQRCSNCKTICGIPCDSCTQNDFRSSTKTTNNWTARKD